MSTSRTTFALSKPSDVQPIPEATLSYLRTRHRLRAFDMIQGEFDRSGLSKAALASRLCKDPGQVNRLLNAPGNWTLDTVSDLLFAICGGVPAYSIDYPLDKPVRNNIRPAWALDNLQFVANWSPTSTQSSDGDVAQAVSGRIGNTQPSLAESSV